MRNQNGFTLLEVLVTMLIISLGLLGIAGIIANSLKVNQGAYTRSQASLLSNDIIDRMRANRITAEVDPSPYGLASCADAPATPTTVVQTDIKQWCDAIAATLPFGTGTGSITVGAAPTWKITVGVTWDDTRAAGVADQELTVETRL